MADKKPQPTYSSNGFLQRILVIRLTALGDVVLAEPVARALRAKFPGARVELLTDARYVALMGRAGFDTVHGYERHGADSGWSGMSRVKKRLGSGFDLIVDLQGKLRTRVLGWRLGGRRLTLRKRTLAKALLALLGHDPPLTGRHATELYLGTLVPFGIDPPTDGPALALPAGDRATTEQVVGLCPGATHATKRWPPEKFAELASALGKKIVLIGGPNDRDSLATIRATGGSNIDSRDLSEMDVLGLAEVIATLDLLVSVDTGPAHIAAAAGVPVVALFGPTPADRWGPRGSQHRIVSLGLPCSPCSNKGTARCPIGTHACMQDLDLQLVLQAVNEVLG